MSIMMWIWTLVGIVFFIALIYWKKQKVIEVLENIRLKTISFLG